MLYKKDIYLFIIINKKGYSITIPQLINQLYIHHTIIYINYFFILPPQAYLLLVLVTPAFVVKGFALPVLFAIILFILN